MPPIKQKVMKSKQPRRRSAQAKKSQPVTTTPEATSSRLKLKINLKPGAHEGSLPPVSVYQFPFSAPPSDDAVEQDVKDNTAKWLNEQGTRRGGRQRTKTHAPDMVFGSELDNLVLSAIVNKVDDDNVMQMVNSPPTIANKRAPACADSPDTIQAPTSPPHYSSRVSQDVYDILNTLNSSPRIQVDLPDMSSAGARGVTKPYTATLLTQLYIQCYETQLWHFCDLIADTWIRALQKANRRSHKSKDEKEHLWRENRALEKKFRHKKKGFKNDVFDFGLDVQDPDIAADVADCTPAQLRELYAHTAPKCGARLLWADAVALHGRKMESSIVERPDVWPADLFYDVMCTCLRMVGRKLTLKIEERYEGAWCRYHEHIRHGQPCYRELAWLQSKERKGGEDEDGDGVEEVGGATASGEKRGVEALGSGGDEQVDAKRVRFDIGETVDLDLDLGDVDAEGESEEEG